MTLTERRVGDVTLLKLAGRLVYDEGDAMLRARINESIAEGRLKIVLDMREITFLDSRGVGELVARLVSVRRKGGDLRLLQLSPRSYRVMEISQLLGVFDTFDSEPAAVASFSPSAGS